MLQSLGISPEEIGFGDLTDKKNTQKKSRTRKSGESSPNLGQLKKDLTTPNVTRQGKETTTKETVVAKR